MESDYERRGALQYLCARSGHGPDQRQAELCPNVLRIRFHDQQHMHMRLLEDGETERYVVQRSGDTVEVIHETYGHVTPGMRIDAVRRLAGRLAAAATARDRLRQRRCKKRSCP